VTLELAVTEWEIAPASDQEVNVFCVPVDTCGEVVTMVCVEPTVQLKVCVLV
jgi:hypothetical protein